MTKRKKQKVKLHQPKGRPFALSFALSGTGEQVRVSTGTYDASEAEDMQHDYEAKLHLDIDPRPKKRKGSSLGGLMDWEDFRNRYYDLRVSTLREKTRRCIESELDIAERILKPRRLQEIADTEALTELQNKLLAGVESRYNPPRPRSKHTVKSHMGTIIAALNWAKKMGWLTSVPEITEVKTSKLKQMKGRPVAEQEFQSMLDATEGVVGADAAGSWKYVLRGLWESGLRLEELLNVSWDDPNHIMPIWGKDQQPVLAIPADMQKNDTDEAIPLLPGFESLLEVTPDHERYSWVFNPVSLHGRVGRKVKNRRLQADWIGKVIGKIGKAAGVMVEPAKGRKPAKYASAHDLRRGCADHLIEPQGVDERDVQAVLRHASAETTRRHYTPDNVERSGKLIRQAIERARVHFQGTCGQK